LVPGEAVLEHGVEAGDELAHGGDEDEFFVLAGLFEAVCEGGKDGVVLKSVVPRPPRRLSLATRLNLG
jgi:hypothetical protein